MVEFGNGGPHLHGVQIGVSTVAPEVASVLQNAIASALCGEVPDQFAVYCAKSNLDEIACFVEVAGAWLLRDVPDWGVPSKVKAHPDWVVHVGLAPQPEATRVRVSIASSHAVPTPPATVLDAMVVYALKRVFDGLTYDALEQASGDTPLPTMH